MTTLKVIYTSAFVFFFVALNAQVGEISVDVRNTKGDEIYKAKVIATKNSDGSFVKEVIVDRYGRYSVKPLPPGLYNLKISAKDYVSQEYSGVTVGEDRTTCLIAKLEPLDKKKSKK